MDIEIHPNRSKLMGMAVLCLIFAIAGFFMALDEALSLFKRVVMGVGGGLFFGAGFCLFICKLRGKKASLVIGEAGIRDNTSLLKVGLIPWQDIVSLQIIEISKQHFLGIEVRDPEKYLREMKPLARRAASFNIKHYGYAILFPQTLLGTPLVEVIRHIEQRLDRAATRPPASVNPHPVQTVLELLL